PQRRDRPLPPADGCRPCDHLVLGCRTPLEQLSSTTMTELTRILSALENGDARAAAELLPLVYDELRKLAAARLAQEKPGQTLQATALVHEAYVRMVDVDKAQHWNSRRHFFAAAAEAAFDHFGVAVRLELKPIGSLRGQGCGPVRSSGFNLCSAPMCNQDIARNNNTHPGLYLRRFALHTRLFGRTRAAVSPFRRPISLLHQRDLDR